MARIKLILPSHKLGTVHIPVRITDINYGNHLGNDAMVSIIHEARVQYLASVQCIELDVGGASLIMAELAVEYKSESFYGDMLQINIFLGEITAAGFELFYEIKNQEEKLVAKAKTGMVCFNYDTRKLATIPDKLSAIFQS